MVVPGRPLILTKSRKTFGRIKNVFPDLDSESYKRAIEAIDRGMKSVQRSLKSEGLFAGDRTAGDYARIALPLDDSSLQWSPVGAGLAADPQKTFDQLYLRFVSRYDRPSERRRSDNDVWRPVEAKLKEHGVNVELEPSGSKETRTLSSFVMRGRTGAGTSMSHFHSTCLTRTTSRIRHAAGWGTFQPSRLAQPRMFRFIS